MKKSGSVRNSFVIIVFIILVSAFLFSSVTYANAVTTWAKIYGGSYNDSISSIKLTKDGGYIAAGMTLSFGAGGVDSWILKLDQGGNIQWQKTYGGGSWERTYYQSKDEAVKLLQDALNEGQSCMNDFVIKLKSFENINDTIDVTYYQDNRETDITVIAYFVDNEDENREHDYKLIVK